MLLFTAAIPTLIGKPAADIASPQNRQSAVNVASLSVTRSTSLPVSNELKNPFNPAGWETSPAISDEKTMPEHHATELAPPADSVVLEQIATALGSAGVAVKEGKLTMVLGGRRLEIGSLLPTSFGGKPLEVEVVAITATSFTLRYRDAEFTRPLRVSNR